MRSRVRIPPGPPLTTLAAITFAICSLKYELQKNNNCAKTRRQEPLCENSSVKIRRYVNSARLVDLSCPAGAGRLARGVESTEISSEDTPEKEDTARSCNLQIVAGGEEWTFEL
jgi:hypothetical protein